MPRTALNTTYNFLDLHVHSAGRWKTPRSFHYWSALSLIAACVEDRVYMDLFRHAPLYPNIWTFLLGLSGVGKDHAIGVVKAHLRHTDPLTVVDKRVTVPGLYDLLRDRQQKISRESAPFWLISSELGELLPIGESEDFCSRVLPLYGGRPRVTGDATRTSGNKELLNPMMNWLGGTTPEWFPRAISGSVFQSGFAGRSNFIFGEPDKQFTHLIQPDLPTDYDQVMTHMRTRVELLMSLEGQMWLTDKAVAWMNRWLREQQDRKFNTDIEASVAERHRTQALKLGMLFSLAEWRGEVKLETTHEHLAAAVAVLQSISGAVLQLADVIYKTVDTQVLEHVGDLIRGARSISRSELLTKATKRGCKGARHLDEIIATLGQMGRVTTRRPQTTGRGRNRTLYEWVNRPSVHTLISQKKRHPDDPFEDTEEGSTHD